MLQEAERKRDFAFLAYLEARASVARIELSQQEARCASIGAVRPVPIDDPRIDDKVSELVRLDRAVASLARAEQDANDMRARITRVWAS